MLIPSPGLALIQPLEEKSELIITSKNEGRILKGTIIEMGPDDMNNYGGILKADNYGKKGDVVYFLSYYGEGGYDQIKIDNVDYYFVKFGDIRGKIT